MALDRPFEELDKQLENEVEALMLEYSLIKEHRPRFNVRLRDDKKFPYLKVTVQEPVPRIFVTRNTRQDGALLFGPYTSVREMRKALRAVSQDRDAAAIAGIDPNRMNMLAFALGGMIAALAGALLVQAFSWLPQVGAIPAMRSFVIVVLGGLGLALMHRRAYPRS